MQNFSDGGPPPPPPSHSWKKIDRWSEKNYTELFDNLCEGCSQNDINELEHELDLSLPQDVRESLSIHDGQERGGRPTGIIIGCMLLDCEEIVQEWNNWKVVNEEYLSGVRKATPHYPLKSLNTGPSSSSSTHQQQGPNKYWRQDLLDRQDSQPPKAIQKAYAHPSWIPLARDWGGNNIAVDLAPGPMGKWGQIILFGRDFDCKYVIARSWSHFLSVVADDITSDRITVDEESGDMKLKEFKTENVEPAYMEILRWRSDQKYGRKGPVKKQPLGLNTSVNGVSNSRGSPYGSPIPGEDNRGRSPQRFSRSGTGSPRHTAMASSLARVAEESGSGTPRDQTPGQAGGDVVRDFGAETFDSSKSLRSGKLVDAPTPVDQNQDAVRKNKLVDAPTPPVSRQVTREFPSTGLSRVSTETDFQESHDQKRPDEMKGLGVNGVEDEMKTVSI